MRYYMDISIKKYKIYNTNVVSNIDIKPLCNYSSINDIDLNKLTNCCIDTYESMGDIISKYLSKEIQHIDYTLSKAFPHTRFVDFIQYNNGLYALDSLIYKFEFNTIEDNLFFFYKDYNEIIERCKKVLSTANVYLLNDIRKLASNITHLKLPYMYNSTYDITYDDKENFILTIRIVDSIVYRRINLLTIKFDKYCFYDMQAILQNVIPIIEIRLLSAIYKNRDMLFGTTYKTRTKVLELCCKHKYYKLMYKIFIENAYIKNINMPLLNYIATQLCTVKKYDPIFIKERLKKLGGYIDESC